MYKEWLIVMMVACVRVGAAPACPADYVHHPVILVAFDGFRPDYLERGQTPTLHRLAENGVHALYLQPSYPTQTFPNHYSIVTGLYPESHGIVSNKFYDPDFGELFENGKKTGKQGKWWGGEPIWNTLTRQGKISATYFWPGSDVSIDGKHPTYWRTFNISVPFTERVDQVLEWLFFPPEKRPDLVTMYFDEPDHTAHSIGIDDAQINKRLKDIDEMMKRLLDGLEKGRILHCVNIIVVADHGMASSVGLSNHTIKLKDYVPDIYDRAYIFPGPFARLNLKNKSEEEKLDMMNKLVCKRDELRVYRREDLPKRFHFSNNRRIDDIILDLNPGYVVSLSMTYTNIGNHGYDYYQDHNMDAIFIASGPDFKKNMLIESFHNIELYNLLCHLTGVEPAPNNGTLGSLYHILANPPQYPQLPKEEKPYTSEFPKGDLGPLLTMSGCSGDLKFPEKWLSSLIFTSAEKVSLEALHLPWGIPHSGALPAGLTLLHHTDHVTGYSKTLKMPLWTSFTLTRGQSGTPSQQRWSSDVRLHPTTTQTCSSYLHLKAENITMYPLFPPKYSKNSSLVRLPYMVSNGVPVSPSLKEHWEHFVDLLLSTWLSQFGIINVLVGPVFDNNIDSYPDDFTHFNTPEVPSDLFAVVTRCKEPKSSLANCPHEKLDANAFILPQKQIVSNCLDDFKYAHKFGAKVHDVEVVTGLTMYPAMRPNNRLALILRSHPDMW